MAFEAIPGVSQPGLTHPGSVDSTDSGTGASTLGGVTSEGTVTVNPTGSGASLAGGITSVGSGYEWHTGSGSSTLGGVTSSAEGDITGTRLEINVNGVWTDITTAIRHSGGVNIVRGKSSSGSQMTTTRCSFTLDNRDHRFSPFNPNGEFYGYLTRSTEIRMTKQEVGVRFHGEISSYTFGTDKSGNDLVVNVECAGLMRRLEQGETPKRSVLNREIRSQSALVRPSHYWPCEETSGATQFSDGFGGSPMKWTSGNPKLADNDGFKCSHKLPDVNGTIWNAPYIIGGNLFTEGYCVAFLMSAPSGITAGARIMSINATVGEPEGQTEWSWDLTYTGTDTLQVAPPALTGSTTDDGTFGIAGELIQVQVLFKSHVGSGAGDASMSVYCQNIDDAEPTLVATATATNGPGNLRRPRLVINTDGTMSDVYIGHVTIYEDDTVRTFNNLAAFLGEPAGTRFERLCTEEGITFEGQGDMADTSPMGYQSSDKTFTDLLKECEATDMGVMYEIREDLGLGYRTRRSLYNQVPTATFDYAGNHLLEELKPIYDDKDIRNEVTVQRDGGSFYTHEVTDGSMSTFAVPDGIGRYETSVTVSLEKDEDTRSQAAWRAHLGTVDEVRVASIKTGLEVPEIDADDALRTALLAVDVGDRVVVENTPAWFPPGDVDQLVDGYTEHWDPTEHRFQFNTSPASPYSVAQVTAAATSSTQAKVGPESFWTLIDTALSTTDTELSLSAATTDTWTENGVPFDIVMNGEQMTVTAVSGTPQTFTVTRSVNGAVKEHEAFSGFRLYKPAIIAL